MDASNIYRFNGVDPFDNWTISHHSLIGYYPRNSLINQLTKLKIDDIEHFIIPNGVTSIEGSCFRNNRIIKTVKIPPSVVRICNRAFTNTDVTLIVHKNSYSERYAQRKGLKYLVI